MDSTIVKKIYCSPSCCKKNCESVNQLPGPESFAKFLEDAANKAEISLNLILVGAMPSYLYVDSVIVNIHVKFYLLIKSTYNLQDKRFLQGMRFLSSFKTCLCTKLSISPHKLSQGFLMMSSESWQR